MLATPLTQSKDGTYCLSPVGTRHKLVIKAPAHASVYSFDVNRIVPSSLRLAGGPVLLAEWP